MLSNLLFSVLASESNGTLLDVNPGLIFWTFLTFIVLLLILRKVAWKPILTALDQREMTIQESLSKAEKAKEEAQKILDQNQNSLAKAEDEARKIIEQSRSYAEKLKDQILADGKLQSQKLISEAAAEIERKNQAAFEQLKSEVVDIAISAAGKLLDEKLDKETHTKVVNKFINELVKN